jgi:hypothetical protein
MTFERWIVLIAILIIALVVTDEVIYYWWRSLNPGHQWKGIAGQTAPLVDPNMPPTVYE